MPLATYTTNIPGGFIITPPGLPPVAVVGLTPNPLPLPVAGGVAIPLLEGPPAPAGQAIIVAHAQLQWAVWQQGGIVRWATVAALADAVTAGPANMPRCVNLTDVDGVLHFSIT
jgi:hypothetical protein